MEIKNEQEFNELLANESYVVVDFFATWCGPCKMLAPFFSQLADELEGVKLVKVDIDQNQELADKYDVKSIPTIIYFKEGKEIDRTLGFMDKSKLADKINSLK